MRKRTARSRAFLCLDVLYTWDLHLGQREEMRKNMINSLSQDCFFNLTGNRRNEVGITLRATHSRLSVVFAATVIKLSACALPQPFAGKSKCFNVNRERSDYY